MISVRYRAFILLFKINKTWISCIYLFMELIMGLLFDRNPRVEQNQEYEELIIFYKVLLYPFTQQNHIEYNQHEDIF